jgi:hypothetical protein
LGYNGWRYGIVPMEGRKIMLTPEEDRRIAMEANRKNKTTGGKGILIVLAA